MLSNTRTSGVSLSPDNSGVITKTLQSRTSLLHKNLLHRGTSDKRFGTKGLLALFIFCLAFTVKSFEQCPSNPGVLTATVTGNVYCPGGNSGAITANSPAGGALPWKFAITAGPVTVPAQSDSVFSGLPAGTYTLVATDGCGTTRGGTYTIIEDTGYITFGAGVAFFQIGCSDLGAQLPQMYMANIQRSTGPPIRIWWVTPNNDTIKGSNAFVSKYDSIYTLQGYQNTSGTYTAIVMDTCGRTYTISAGYGGTGNSLSTPSTFQFNDSCSNYSLYEGFPTVIGISINWQILNSKDSSVYTEASNTGTWASPVNASPVFPLALQYGSSYIIKATTSCGNVYWSGAFQNSGPALATYTGQGPGCSVPGTGAIDVYAFNGVPPYTFKIISGPGKTSNIGDSVVNNGGVSFRNLILGTYIVQTTDNCGAVVYDTVTANKPLALNTSYTITPNCNSGGSANVHVVIQSNYYDDGPYNTGAPTRLNATQPVNYIPVNVTQTGNAVDSFTTWTGDLQNVDTGYLYIDIISNNDEGGCDKWDTLYIPLYTSPNIDSVTGFLCNDTAVLNATVPIASLPLQYRVKPATSSTWSGFQLSNVFPGLSPGVKYNIQVQDACVNNSNIDTFTLQPTFTPTPVSAPACATLGQSYTLTGQNVYPGGVTYQWVKNGAVVYTGASYTIFSFGTADTGTYYLRQTTVGGCMDSTMIDVTVCPPPYDDSSFITQWTTTAANTTVNIPITGSGFNIAWQGVSPTTGSGTVVANGSSTSITFPDAGTYQVSIPPGAGAATPFSAITVNSSYLTQITQWGKAGWTSFNNAFQGCNNLTVTATDTPSLAGVADMTSMFNGCTSLTAVPNINSWNVSNVTNMNNMFNNARAFNQSLNNWNVSNVTDMSYMFYNAAGFNQPLNNWNTGSVTDFSGMFNAASAFDQNIGNWNTSNVTTMRGMFFNNYAFNQDISSWNTGKVTDMSVMFQNATAFNQNISNWNTSSVTTMNSMFAGATVFNQPLNGWNTGNVTDMTAMFDGATVFDQNINNWNTGKVTGMRNMFQSAPAFNQPLGNWDVSNATDISGMFNNDTAFNQNINNWNTGNVTNMDGTFWNTHFNQPLNNWNTSKVTDMGNMFQNTTAFNQPLNNWNTGSVTYMSGMFQNATAFDQPLNNWNVSSVTNMYLMFYQATAFNQPLNNWNTSKVSGMGAMFQNATAFNQNLGSWNLSSVSDMGNMLSNSGLSCLSYDSTLQGWADSATTPSNIDFGAQGLSYDTPGQTAITTLTATKGWTTNPTFGTYSIGCAAATAGLPIELTDFTAQAQGNTALLEWTTATEINNKGFEIQRSSNAQTWNNIAFVNSQAVNGNSSSVLNYSFTDNNPASGVNYYRLAQEDLNGTVAYSPVRSIDFGVKATVYPNPASTQLNVSVAVNSNYQLIDILGKTVLTGSLNAGNNIIDVSGITNGIYILRITAGSSASEYKVMIKR